jgi:peroxiredoxin
VVPQSPAAHAGLQSGDLIVRLDNEAVAVPADVIRWVSGKPAGTKVSVMAKRAGHDRLLGVQLGAFPEGDELVRMTFVDQPAPAFEFLKTAQGSVHPTLGAHRGNVLIVEFWAPWCVACRALIPHMNQWHAEYGARGLRVLGITSERVPRAAAAAHELGMEFPILADETGRTTRSYQARAVPTVFVIDRQGTIRDVMIGYDSKRLEQLDELVHELLEK